MVEKQQSRSPGWKQHGTSFGNQYIDNGGKTTIPLAGMETRPSPTQSRDTFSLVEKQQSRSPGWKLPELHLNLLNTS